VADRDEGQLACASHHRPGNGGVMERSRTVHWMWLVGQLILGHQ
jgi:hypothetical protein